DKYREETKFKGLTAEVEPNSQVFSPFDLSLNVLEVDGRLRMEARYKGNQLSAETVQRWLNHFKTLLAQMAAKPNALLPEVSLLTPTECSQIVEEWNKTHVERALDLCVTDLFEAQVLRSPGEIALVYGEQQFSYRDLDECAKRWSEHLVAMGVRPD